MDERTQYIEMINRMLARFDVKYLKRLYALACNMWLRD